MRSLIFFATSDAHGECAKILASPRDPQANSQERPRSWHGPRLTAKERLLPLNALAFAHLYADSIH